MSIKLISFFENHRHEPATFLIAGIPYEASSIQEALIGHLLERLPPEETLTLILLKSLSLPEVIPPETLRPSARFSIITQSVPIGHNEGEIWAIFDRVVDDLHDGDRIYLDITHGHRGLNLIVASIMGYVEEIYDEIILEEIFCAADEFPVAGETIPVFLLKQIDTLQKWTTATDKFLKSGQRDIVLLIEKEIKTIKRRGMKADPLLLPLEKIRKNLDFFIQSLKTNRTQDTIKYALILKHYFKEIKHHPEDTACGLKPFLRILEKINRMVAPFREDELIYNTHQIVKLCFSFGMYQQVFTLLGENGTNCLLALSQAAPADFFDVDARDRIRKDYFEYCKKKNLSPAISKLDKKYFEQKYQNFILNALRNDVNHGGFSADAVDWKAIIKNGEKLIHTFETLFLKDLCVMMEAKEQDKTLLQL